MSHLVLSDVAIMGCIGELGGKVEVMTQGFGDQRAGDGCVRMPMCVCVRTVWSEGKTEASQLSWVTSDWLKRFLCIGEVNTLHTPSLPGIPCT